MESTHVNLGPRFTRWLDRRIPPSSEIRLSQRNVFIFPTKTGFAFGGLILALILGAINYQASLVFGVAFVLGSLFLVTILHTFRNLSGLVLELADSRAAFVGEDLEYTVRVHNARTPGREGIWLGWPGSLKQYVDLCDQQSALVRLYVRGEQRGWQHPGRLLIETNYPLGLLRAWTWVDLAAKALVYPRPIFGPNCSAASATDPENGGILDKRGSDDFVDIKSYQVGDPIKHILWRSYARSGDVAVRQYGSYVEPASWLDFSSLEGDVEERLSLLTGLALQAERAGCDYGLRIAGTEIQPNQGGKHLEAVLTLLALHGAPRS